MILEIFAKLFEISFSFFKVAIIVIQLIWNLYVLYYFLSLIVFALNNAILFIIIGAIFPALITSTISFFQGAFVTIHARGRR